MTHTAWGVGSLATKKMLERGQHRPRHWPRGTLGAPAWQPPRPRPPAIPVELFWEADDIRSAPGSHPPPGRQMGLFIWRKCSPVTLQLQVAFCFPCFPALRPGCCCLY